MHVIVPLAGPDFVHPDGSIKALISFEEQPFLKYVLNSRPWASKVEFYTFVLYDSDQTRRFARDFLCKWFLNFSVVFISGYSRGAAISTLAGISLVNRFGSTLVVDLADIVYKSNLNIEQALQTDSAIGGIALVFNSNHPQYSYLATNDYRQVITAAEKVVISEHASAGTYIFRDSATLLKAIAHAVENESTQTHNNLFYVCPLFNGVLAQNKQVILEHVSGIIDIKSNAINGG